MLCRRSIESFWFCGFSFSFNSFPFILFDYLFPPVWIGQMFKFFADFSTIFLLFFRFQQNFRTSTWILTNNSSKKIKHTHYCSHNNNSYYSLTSVHSSLWNWQNLIWYIFCCFLFFIFSFFFFNWTVCALSHESTSFVYLFLIWIHTITNDKWLLLFVFARNESNM